MKKILVLILLIISFNQAFSTTLDEVINSYDFSYEDESFKLNNLSYNFNKTLNVNLDFENKFGNYEFVLDFNNMDLVKFRVSNYSYFTKGNNKINFSIPLKYNLSSYNLTLNIYNDGLIIYRNYFNINLKNVSISNQTLENIFYFENEKSIKNNLKYLSYNEIKNADNLIESLIFNFEINLRGNYEIDFYLEDKLFEKKFNIDDGNLEIEIKGEELYKLFENNFFEINKLIIFKNEVQVSSLLINNFTQKYFQSDFIKPELSDLSIEFQNQSNSSIINVSIKNQGNNNAFGILYKVLFENSSILKEGRIELLKENETYFLGSYNLSSFYILVDYNQEILELNESNNIFVWPIPIIKQVKKENISQKNLVSSYSSSSSGTSSNKKSSNKNSFEEFQENRENELNETEEYLQENKTKNNFKNFEFKEKINFNNVSFKPKIKDNLEKVQELIVDDKGFFDVGFLSFVGSIFVSIFSVVFLLL